MKIRKAVITCAGFGTRFLPITKTIQKEMLPILERPLIDYVVEDCVKAGIEEIIFVMNANNYQVMHFYQENHRLHNYLQAKNKLDLYQQISQLHTRAKFSFVKQQDSDPYGTAVPVMLAKDKLQNEEAFLVLMGDDFIYAPDKEGEIARMIKTYQAAQANALMTCIVKPDKLLSKYGVVQSKTKGQFNFLERIVEKPAPGQAPSNSVNISKYILSQDIWPILAQQKPNPQSDELYITDSIQTLAQNKPVVIHHPQGEYLDGGYPLGWLLANLTVARNKAEMWAVIKDFVNQA